jgi:hypothetical protein
MDGVKKTLQNSRLIRCQGLTVRIFLHLEVAEQIFTNGRISVARECQRFIKISRTRVQLFITLNFRKSEHFVLGESQIQELFLELIRRL